MTAVAHTKERVLLRGRGLRLETRAGRVLVEGLNVDIGLESVSARAVGFALASSEERSFGVQISGVQAAYEPLVSTLPGLVAQDRYLNASDNDAIVIGRVLATNLRATVGDEITLEWFDGVDPAFYPPAEIMKMYPGKEYPEEAAMFVGEKGYLLLPHTSGPMLLPREKFGQDMPHSLADFEDANRLLFGGVFLSAGHQSIFARMFLSEFILRAVPLTPSRRSRNLLDRSETPTPWT